jgi:hypothetical protein
MVNGVLVLVLSGKKPQFAGGFVVTGHPEWGQAFNNLIMKTMQGPKKLL